MSINLQYIHVQIIDIVTIRNSSSSKNINIERKHTSQISCSCENNYKLKHFSATTEQLVLVNISHLRSSKSSSIVDVCYYCIICIYTFHLPRSCPIDIINMPFETITSPRAAGSCSSEQ